MIKTVLFDFGGVLTEGGKVGAVRKIFARAYGVPADTLRTEEVGLQALKGQVSDDQFLAVMNQKFPDKPPVTKQQFLATVDFLIPSPPVYQLADALRAKGIRTGIMSNTFTMAADVLRRRGLYDNFDPLLLSCAEHLAKPEQAFYELALRNLGLPPAEILLIDDQALFLAPAQKLGMHTILALSPDQIVRDTKQLIHQQNGITL